jgi:uncharacterized protein YdaU (DUF1376 family)
MHYYQHHIGDFIKDTSFLTNEEVGIYLKLLWLYYDSETPLPNSLLDLSMKVNAREQKDSLLGILNMFFVFKDDCWHHNRCDKEISHYHQQLTTASKAGKASALKRALNKDSTGVQRALDSCSTGVQPTSNHEPITNNQEPYKERTRGSRLSADFVLPTEWADWAKQERPDLDLRSVGEQFRDYWSAKAGSGSTKLDWQATWRNWVRNQKQVFKQADIARTTVPSSSLRDPALAKLDEDMKNAKPNPEILAKIKEALRGKVA